MTVQLEFKNNVQVSATNAFLDKLLNVEQNTVDQIFGRLVQLGKYDQDEALWHDFLQSKDTEQASYISFAAAANAVNEACTALESPIQIQTTWLDRHNTLPHARNSDAPTFRPDIVAVLGATKDMKKLDAEIHTKEDTARLRDG
ncbi:hypothetical protein B0H21DRAFT_743505, partial [Amylocystis lapponica]